MMFFGKKKPKGPVPLEAVKMMSAKGLSDRDIIKKLKKKGYAYNDIEKAMLHAVKDGVEEKPISPSPPISMAPIRKEPMPREEAWNPPQSPPPEKDIFEQPVMGEEIPHEDNDDTELILEELVEGIVQEKWDKFDNEIKKYGNEIVRLKAEVKSLSQKLSMIKMPENKTEDVSDIRSRMDDLDIRIGGLEKAFKQFLPSLTNNIESLSEMIEEMKSKKEYA